MTQYTAVTDADLAEMLSAIGVGSVQELFDRQIPADVRLGRPLDLPAGLPEQEVYAHLRDLAAKNTSAEDEITFLGAGMYDHYVPAVIDMLLGRSEFLTPYTPYQPEVSQGNLQAMFEYQTAISELTGLPVSNASVYEGPSAVASAGYLARLANGKPKFVVSRGLHPHSRETLATYAHGFGAEIVEVPLKDGVTDPDAWAAAIDGDTGAVFFQQPNFLGAVEDAAALASAAKDSPAVVVGQYDPIPLGILKPPGECGVDVCVGEGQTLGNRLDFGGPSFGFFAATEAYLRRMPGRIAGETVDADGRRGFVLTLQTREQHIRREKATSNICTAQALNALAGVVYLTWLGKQGLVDLGELLLQRTHYARERLVGVEGVSALHEQPVVREFALELAVDGVAAVGRVIARCQEAGVNPGYALGREYDEFPNGLLVALTEQRSKADVDQLVEVLGAAVAAERATVGGDGMNQPLNDNKLHGDPGIEAHMLHHEIGVGGPGTEGATPMQRDRATTIFEKGAAGRRAFVAPAVDVPVVEGLLPDALRRDAVARLPEVSEPELVRHYVKLSRRNFDLDTGFYPLGSCTMKHNPRLHERVASLPGHSRLHPLQAPEHSQGALELMYNLERALGEVSGLPHVSLQPSAGSHGELAGVLLTRAFHEDRGQIRTKVLTPDTAHGTNPATVTMAGFTVVKVGTNPDGGVDLDDLRAKADDTVACLMLTNPNTLGVFDPNITEIAKIVHDVGATLYYDGANLNAIMGKARPGDMGFDIVHFNLHKSFTQPHGGGGPGSGPIAVSERMRPYLMNPRIVKGEDGVFDLDDHGYEKSIGRLRGFQGNYGCFVRSYAYICSLGGEGLTDASETAVLNANYLLAKLKEKGVADKLPLAFGELCMHEFVLSGSPMKKDLGIKTLDLAKRLLDHGYHPPTVYFPLLVDEALLVEPTETETKETLDGFADAIAAILTEADGDPLIAQNAPYTTPVRRLDEARAAKSPVIRQPIPA